MRLLCNCSTIHHTSLNSLSRLFDLVPWSHDSILTLAFVEQGMPFVIFFALKHTLMNYIGYLRNAQ